MNQSFFSSATLRSASCGVFTICFIVFVSLSTYLIHADEWKARHALISPTGVMNLSEPPLAEEIFFPGTAGSGEAEAWRAGLKAWRADRTIRLRYDGSQYDRPELAWTQQVFSQCNCSCGTGAFTILIPANTQWIDFSPRPRSRIGPIDAVLIWHVYPNLGVDDRNQFDLLRDLPGGVPGVATNG